MQIHGSQNMTFDIGKLNATIDGSSATLNEKAEAKSLLERLSKNKLLTNLLELRWRQ
jgi:hypothetical protein